MNRIAASAFPLHMGTDTTQTYVKVSSLATSISVNGATFGPFPEVAGEWYLVPLVVATTLGLVRIPDGGEYKVYNYQEAMDWLESVAPAEERGAVNPLTPGLEILSHRSINEYKLPTFIELMDAAKIPRDVVQDLTAAGLEEESDPTDVTPEFVKTSSKTMDLSDAEAGKIATAIKAVMRIRGAYNEALDAQGAPPQPA